MIYALLTTVGGFSGHIHLAAIGAQPPVVEPEPQRPAHTDEGEEFEG